MLDTEFRRELAQPANFLCCLFDDLQHTPLVGITYLHCQALW